MKRIVVPLLVLPAVASADLVMIDGPGSDGAGSGSSPIMQIRPMPAPKEEWVGERGESLRSAVLRWAERGSWNVIWDTSTDYPLLAPVKFEGRIDEAVADFVRLYERAEKPLVADIQRQQSLIYVTDRKAR